MNKKHLFIVAVALLALNFFVNLFAFWPGGGAEATTEALEQIATVADTSEEADAQPELENIEVPEGEEPCQSPGEWQERCSNRFFHAGGLERFPFLDDNGDVVGYDLGTAIEQLDFAITFNDDGDGRGCSTVSITPRGDLGRLAFRLMLYLDPQSVVVYSIWDAGPTGIGDVNDDAHWSYRTIDEATPWREPIEWTMEDLQPKPCLIAGRKIWANDRSIFRLECAFSNMLRADTECFEPSFIGYMKPIK